MALKKVIPAADAVAPNDDMDLARYVENRYCLGVTRDTTSGFMRLNPGPELKQRQVSSHVFESGREVPDNLR